MLGRPRFRGSSRVRIGGILNNQKTVGDLNPSDYNPRKITPQELAALKSALEVFGDLGGVVFNRTTGRLVGGHQRVKTLDASWPIKIIIKYPEPTKTGTVAQGHIETPFGDLYYREVEWTEAVEKAANIAANQHGGSWDDAKLKDLLVGLDDGSGLLSLTGFNEVDLSGLIERQAAAEEKAPIAETPAEKENLFEQLVFVLTREQMAEVGFALDKAIKAGDFGATGNANARGNALARIAAAYAGKP